jgi:urease accessory protein
VTAPATECRRRRKDACARARNVRRRAGARGVVAARAGASTHLALGQQLHIGLGFVHTQCRHRHRQHLALARADLAVLVQALPAWDRGDTLRLRELDDWVLRTRETQELRLQSEQMGRSLVEWLKTVRPDHAARAVALGHLTYPVAYALASQAAMQAGAGARAMALGFAFGWAENMAQAAIKSVPLGQSAGQRILARLATEIPAAVDTALALPDDERQSFSPMLAVLSARHEHQYSRLFRS